MQQMVEANPNPMVLSNQRIHPYVSGISVKRSLNVVQSAWCELCKIVCNNQVNLNSHKLGKKHKKNLKKLEESKSVVNVAAEPTATVVFEVEDATTVKEMPSGESSQAEPAATVVAEVEDTTTVKEMPSGESAQAEPAATVVLEVEDSTTVKEIPSGESAQGKKARRKSKHEEDLETKRQKLMKGGTAVDSLRACIICNVVCNSETVFQMHLAGQKHAAKVNKLTVVIGIRGINHCVYHYIRALTENESIVYFSYRFGWLLVPNNALSLPPSLPHFIMHV